MHSARSASTGIEILFYFFSNQDFWQSGLGAIKIFALGILTESQILIDATDKIARISIPFENWHSHTLVRALIYSLTQSLARFLSLYLCFPSSSKGRNCSIIDIRLRFIIEHLVLFLFKRSTSQFFSFVFIVNNMHYSDRKNKKTEKKREIYD